MRLYTEDQINKILEDSNTLVHFKDGLSKIPETDCGIIDTVKVEEDDTITIMYPESFLNNFADDLRSWVQCVQDTYPDNPVLAILSDIDVLIQNADDAIAMLDGMKAKIQIVKDTPSEKKIVL